MDHGRCHEATLPGKIEWGLGSNTWHGFRRCFLLYNGRLQICLDLDWSN